MNKIEDSGDSTYYYLHRMMSLRLLNYSGIDFKAPKP